MDLIKKNKNTFLTTTLRNKFSGNKATVYLFSSGKSTLSKKIIQKFAASWQKKILLQQINEKELIYFVGKNGPLWLLSRKSKAAKASHAGRLEESDYAWYREQMGSIISHVKSFQLANLEIILQALTVEQELGALVGLELINYSYKPAKNVIQNVKVQNYSKILLEEAIAIARATNMARELVNTPPNFLNPSSMQKLASSLQFKNMKVEVWNEARLKKEKMGLHLAVGQGSKDAPCLIHLRYRPKNKSKLKPVAFVGKGITFDTGGLDIKPSANMRLMKKDMGGAAALFGLAIWIGKTQPQRPIDIYLAMAENSVDAKSFRPSDVVTARNGMTVEIHNTDAEGRLVLADALNVAVTQAGANEPQFVIDVATLTGAIKAGLGADLPGLFSNDDELAEKLNLSGFEAGESNWRMPLYSKYTRGMETPFADIVNCVDGFGGAITAALFLEKFVKNKAWAHLDIYAWNDRAGGSLAFAGGSGQAVQTLIQFLKTTE